MTTFYVKYRPQTIDELDITEVRDSLNKFIKSRRLPHAFLFCGPKGTGKTSAARIIAKIVNCEKKANLPCNKCEQCLSITRGSNIDVIEIDAASHRGIDDARSLRDAVKLAPAKANKKVYIIDEAHMLTAEASNALLKTLEEPPDHVIFILATTNPEKLIETIRSRTVNINFRRATIDEVLRSLKRVIKGEKIKIDDETLSLIAKSSGGSFRDATKVLEQIITEDRSLKKEDVEEYLFHNKSSNIDEIIGNLAGKNIKVVLGEIHDFSSKGGRIKDLIEAISLVLREALLAKVGIGEDKLTNIAKDDLINLLELITKASTETNYALIEELPLEIAVIKWCAVGEGREPEVKIGAKPAEVTKTDIKEFKKTVKEFGEVSEEVWKNILAKVKPINTSIEALLRAARPIGYDGKNLTLGVFYRFHKERLEDGRHRKILEDVVASVFGSPVRVVCTLTEPPVKEVKEEPKEKTILTEGEDKDIIKIAEEIFGN